MWRNIPKYGHIQKCGHNVKKVDRIMLRWTKYWRMIPLGCPNREYDMALQVRRLCPSLWHLLHTIWRVINRLLIRLVLFLLWGFFVTGGLICKVSSIICTRHKLVQNYKHWIVMRQKWHIFHKVVDIFSKMWTFTWKRRLILWKVDIYFEIWIYTPKCGQIF